MGKVKIHWKVIWCSEIWVEIWMSSIIAGTKTEPVK